jgi:hypothetical protein
MIVYKYVLMWIFRFSQQKLWSLVSYEALSTLTDCCLSSEGSWFTPFDGTSCFQNVGNRLPDCTVLHPINSKPNIQIYIAELQNGIHYEFVHPAT